ncbi:MAG: hypothetical protein KTR31_26450 [Myxococcales bacterium]|nr:hypothetical protein [Myxococcales bacterium]
MTLWLWSLAALAQEPAPQIRFEFVGQPECVELHYTDGSTTLTNHCDQPLLLDQSVLQGFRLIAPGETTRISDLSAFTLGLNGSLYRAIAQVVEPEPSPVSEPATKVVATPRFPAFATAIPVPTW